MQLQKTKQKKSIMSITIDFFEDGTNEFNYTQAKPVGLAQVERACNRAVLYVQQQYNKEARRNQDALITKQEKAEKEVA